MIASSHLPSYNTHFSPSCCLWPQTQSLCAGVLVCVGYVELHKLSLAPVMPSKETGGFTLVTEFKKKNHCNGCRVSAQNRRGWFLIVGVVIGLPHWCLVWCCPWESFMFWVMNELNWAVFFNKVKDWETSCPGYPQSKVWNHVTFHHSNPFLVVSGSFLEGKVQYHEGERDVSFLPFCPGQKLILMKNTQFKPIILVLQ